MNQAIGRLLTARKPVQRAACGAAFREEVREGSTGRAVPVRLRRVWAVAEVRGRCRGEGGHPTLRQSEGKDGAPGIVSTMAPEVVSERVPDAVSEAAPEPKVEVAFYRKYTEALLRRYMRMSMSAGRVPSVMGREMFRGHVTHYRAHTFEDVAIFCFDVERQIARLTAQEKELVKRIALQQYTQMEVAGMLGVSLRSCIRRYGEMLDRLTTLFLTAKLLDAETLSRG